MKRKEKARVSIMISTLNTLLNKPKKMAVGLMSGTSLDGIDAAVIEIEGSGIQTKISLLSFNTLPYTNEEKRNILRVCDRSSSSVEQICLLNVVLGNKFADAAMHSIHKAGLNLKDVDFISSHGQTIFHMPDHYATLQIGELSVIASKTGCITVGDFRPSDMAVGGQGAPLVPFVDYLLFRHTDHARILLNIGGMANLTFLPANAKPDQVVAFDTGPGNVLIDTMMSIGTNGRESYDRGGEVALSGQVSEEWLKDLLAQDCFTLKKTPKSTGREVYTQDLAHAIYFQGKARNLSFSDIISTVTAYTAETIILNIQQFADPIGCTKEVLVGGGGSHNQAMMSYLQSRLGKQVASMEDINFSSDAKEAIAFAILGNEFLHGNSNNLPSATGAQRHVPMGKLVLP
ncbi:anhydro-N-acetylmuramic acid kinase [Bacillus salitolerans]|uniref:Anhydro-N-acetylmuramic acid kinase n=1 Tax=Bacillus salitolerans TaxID=1437434 RepID=A0ABW4LQV2_9BACI